MLSWVTYLHIMSYFDKIIFDKGSKRDNVRQNRQNSLVYLGSKRAKTEPKNIQHLSLGKVLINKE